MIHLFRFHRSLIESHSVRPSLAEALDLTSEPFSCLLSNTLDELRVRGSPCSLYSP